MNKAVEAELKSLMTYYGETVDSPEGPKPEDFFSLIVSFSSALRVSCSIWIQVTFDSRLWFA